MTTVVLAVHGIESHAGWFDPLRAALEQHAISLVAVDRAGSGSDPRPRGDTPGLEIWLEEIKQCAARLGTPKVHLLGHSWGARPALAVTRSAPGAFASLVLVTPGLFAASDLPRPPPLDVLEAVREGGGRAFPIGIPDARFSRDPSVLDFIEKDPLRLHEVTARFLREDAGLGRRIAAIRELTVPTTLMLAEHDTIVDGPRTRAWFRATGGEHIDVFEGAGHLVILEQTEALAARVADSVRGGA